MLSLVLIVIASYLIGSIPFGIIISKQFRGFDIRSKGSGNMGSTNAFRVLGWKLGLAVQVLDLAKGLGAVLLATYFFNGLPFHNATPFQDITIFRLIAGCSAVLGHVYTIFAGFHGGKGISTAAGMLIGVAPIEIAIVAGIFLLVVVLSGYVSLGSIIAAIMFPTTMFLRENAFGVHIVGYSTLIVFAIGLALFLIFTHRANITRLIEKRENRFDALRIFRKAS
ncbi:MAG: glycerol-3-phosphate 1-O-acyltransferase PlsY [Bacteroidota bacterium]|nr:glycerol-3-phosphate 1-O-acyltransferase PlsY [Bacteroidota bacterium]MDP4233263.1 glycerol-3-phosphate 1-O-acyltransferase PlsY [Bacteroidota bacterium]MDP4242117.1 glycerol-3-phosphate 1-O-acyltransferase PlsY [Bacteroidota bacterium]MDP4289084.1 glycerol-3-phosphate 1-O-acyltransferase PlsY [Bacteroidota bacterium]